MFSHSAVPCAVVEVGFSSVLIMGVADLFTKFSKLPQVLCYFIRWFFLIVNVTKSKGHELLIFSCNVITKYFVQLQLYG